MQIYKESIALDFRGSWRNMFTHPFTFLQYFFGIGLVLAYSYLYVNPSDANSEISTLAPANSSMEGVGSSHGVDAETAMPLGQTHLASCSNTHAEVSATETTGLFGQSFVATCSGTLNSIGFFINAGSTNPNTLTIYDGDGLGGANRGSISADLDYSSTNLTTDYRSIDVSSLGISIISGNTYTFQITGDVARLYFNTSNTIVGQIYYNGGANAGADLLYNVEIGTALPVEMAYFEAEAKGQEVLLEWATYSELNNKGFYIQRKERDNWEEIGFIAGQGQSDRSQNYRFIDQPLVGRSRYTYRLEQVDFDGKTSYSDQVEVYLDTSPMTLYPNPNIGSFWVDLGTSYQQVQLRFLSVDGKLLDQQQYSRVQQLEVNSDLASGFYLLEIQADASPIQTLNLVIE